MAIDYKSIGSRIKRYRMDKRMSQEDLAEKANLTGQSIFVAFLVSFPMLWISRLSPLSNALLQFVWSMYLMVVSPFAYVVYIYHSESI